MATEWVDGGYQKVGTHTKEDLATLWPHQGDDDLPDPLDLKRRMEQGRRRQDRHRNIQVKVRLSVADRRRLMRLQKRQQLTLTDWVRRAIDLDEAIRPSEAKEYVRKIVPEQVAIIAERELTQAAETLTAVANRQSDWEMRKNLRADAGAIMDAAAWFTEVRKEYERLSRFSHS